MENTQSEIARLQQQIEAEFLSAEQALRGFAQSAKHTFITARYNKIGQCQEQLAELVGEQRAMQMVCDILERAPDPPRTRK